MYAQVHTINAIHVGEIGPEEALVAVDESGRVSVWFTATLDQPPIRLENGVSTWGIATHGPTYLLAVSANSFRITVWDLRDRSPEEKSTMRVYPEAPLGEGCTRRTFSGHTHNIPSVDISPSGRWLVSCSIDGSCRIWRLRDGRCVKQRSLAPSWYAAFRIVFVRVLYSTNIWSI
ncbi:WD40-repeat-containing domain protein [Thamnocephalis sphaerospora]|uniref:WD40-repeat-containing domain protein n=1 Tax=Thamnocephalis sphaerospora TaxID=78915 RepID=A0A4P9XK84_9FUNG|nr:WD40-repeat-containing domain protein [Thamnocephalis sphaerospora]|eukprot:RKP06203.1 WD40-repeat-containing domain protein [Thamnocephalis sphaerospora]